MSNRSVGTRLVRGCCLGIFLVLVTLGLDRFWLPLLLTGIGTTPFWGRWYCRWVCPVSSLGCLRPQNRRVAQAWLHHPCPPRVWLVVLGLLFVTTLVLGLRPRLFALVTVVGVGFGALFGVARWCGYWCPWGRLMTLGTRFGARWRNPS